MLFNSLELSTIYYTFLEFTRILCIDFAFSAISTGKKIQILLKNYIPKPEEKERYQVGHLQGGWAM